jgi:hypothetical protein
MKLIGQNVPRYKSNLLRWPTDITRSRTSASKVATQRNLQSEQNGRWLVVAKLYIEFT